MTKAHTLYLVATGVNKVRTEAIITAPPNIFVPPYFIAKYPPGICSTMYP